MQHRFICCKFVEYLDIPEKSSILTSVFYDRYSVTYKCAPNQEHTNQWFNGWNIVTHRYMAQSLEHIAVQQKVTFKNMVSKMEYFNKYIYLVSELRILSYRHQIDEYNLLLCVFPYSELCQIEYLD